MHCVYTCSDLVLHLRCSDTSEEQVHPDRMKGEGPNVLPGTMHNRSRHKRIVRIIRGNLVNNQLPRAYIGRTKSNLSHRNEYSFHTSSVVMSCISCFFPRFEYRSTINLTQTTPKLDLVSLYSVA